MMNETNIEALKSRLLSLGFPASVEAGLRAQICFGQEAFTLHYRQVREGDTLNVTVYFQRVPGTAEYHISYYDASLRRRIEVPPVQLREVDVGELEARMKRAPWRDIFSRKFLDDTSHAVPVSWEEEDAIESIISDLNRLSESAEEAALAGLLKLKFWADTPLEALIPNLGGQKSGLETGQRFYFFENEEGITLDEAYRFLLHRWREKQLSAQRKAPGPTEASSDNGSATVPGSTRPPGKKRPGKGSKLKR